MTLEEHRQWRRERFAEARAVLEAHPELTAAEGASAAGGRGAAVRAARLAAAVAQLAGIGRRLKRQLCLTVGAWLLSAWLGMGGLRKRDQAPSTALLTSRCELSVTNPCYCTQVTWARDTYYKLSVTHLEKGEEATGMSDAPLSHWEGVMRDTHITRAQVCVFSLVLCRFGRCACDVSG